MNYVGKIIYIDNEANGFRSAYSGYYLITAIDQSRHMVIFDKCWARELNYTYIDYFLNWIASGRVKVIESQ